MELHRAGGWLPVVREIGGQVLNIAVVSALAATPLAAPYFAHLLR